MSELAEYLARIGYEGQPSADLATLNELHRLHVEAIPFENLDVQLGIEPSMGFRAIFDKLVRQRRGGWCYEMNGLFGWALGEIGFEVTRLSCGVMRHVGGEERMGTHLALLVQAEQRHWLADVGFGSSLRQPLALEAGASDEPPFIVSLSETDDGHWRFTEQSRGEPFSYDFRTEPADEALLAARCRWQASATDSNFVQNFVAQKRVGESHLALRGRVMRVNSPTGATEHIVSSEGEFSSILKLRFGIEHPEIHTIWPKVCARHDELFAPVAT